jgi:hypothetical protein
MVVSLCRDTMRLCFAQNASVIPVILYPQIITAQSVIITVLVPKTTGIRIGLYTPEYMRVSTVLFCRIE